MKQVAIVTNGNFPQSLLSEIKKFPFIIGVDRAGFTLIKHGLKPDLVTGDMDSVSGRQLREIKKHSLIKLFNKDKDYTDTELAICEAIKKGYKKATLYGVIGTRLDHQLATIFLLEKYLKKIQLLIRDEKNEMEIADKKREFIKSGRHPFISFLSLTGSSVISLFGFKYPLFKKKIFRGDTLCISNEIVSQEAKIIVYEGKVLIVRSKD